MSEKRSRKTVMLGVVALVAVVTAILVLSVYVMAAPAPGSTLLTAKCTVGPTMSDVFSAPAASENPRLVLHVSWTAINDEDSGLFGYWALDSYKVNLYVWDLRAGGGAGGVAPGTFEYIQLFSGVFESPQGAGSPQYNTNQTATQVGTMSGALEGYFNGTTSYGNGELISNIGTINYNGTTQDLLNRTYGSQIADKTAFVWTSDTAPGASATYFNINGGSSGVSTTEWGFIYNSKSTYSYDANATQWCNMDIEDVGDISTH
jgi:hypothetical protein